MPQGSDLTGKIALVTGGSRGLGRQMALAFAGAGADVVIASRKIDACEAVAAEIRELGRKALPVACHVGQWDDLEKLVDRTYAEFGKLDVLVNNAGMSPLAPSLLETSEMLFDKVVGVNFKGPFRLSILVAERMAQGGGGSIINISSIAATKAGSNTIPYAGAKAALNAISACFAKHYAPMGVRVNVISAGPFMTDVSESWAKDPALRATVPLGRFGDPGEIVGTALYLAGGASPYTTGANIVVDGGRSL
jgi:NAD(P)-dependent dehydrogenase (short-subunit alcohol dehydrogenase family)